MPATPRMGAAVIMVAPPVEGAEPETVAALAADAALLEAADAAELAEGLAELIPDAADEAAEVTAPESEL